MSIFESNISYRPFQYPWAVEVEKKHAIDMHWHENQIELQDDQRQFINEGGLATIHVSHESNKNMVQKLLAVFTEMDLSVGEGYTKILPYVKNNEIRTMLMTFAAREVRHQRGYALAAEEFGFTNADWSEFRQYKEMSDKIDLMTQEVGDLSDKLNFAKMLSVILLGEGIALFGAFACLLNLKRFGLMMNFNTINEWSLKDEQEHVKNNIRVLFEVRKELNEVENEELDKWIVRTTDKYVKAEHAFLDLVYEMGDQEQMTKEDSKEFINYLSELRRYQCGLLSAGEVRQNPLPWIDYILTGSTHTNFFEARVVDYTHNGLEGSVDYGKYQKALEDRVFNN